MPALDPILPHAAPLLLVVTRLGGLFVFTPLLANRTAPRRVRVMLALVLGTALYAGAPEAARTPHPADLVGLGAMLAGELLIGVVLGFLAALPIFALDLAGYVIGHQMGLGLGRVFNPELDSDADVTSQLLMYLGLGAFVALGGLEALFLSLAATLERVPPGAWRLDDLPLDLVVGVMGGGFDLALRVAAPALGIILLVMISLGFIMKSMPQINVLSIGFTIKILCGVGVVAVSLWAMQQAAGDEIVRVLGLADRWAHTPLEPGG